MRSPAIVFMKKSQRKLNRAFTLIEVLIVVAIMAILASLSFPIVSAVKRTAIRNRATVALKGLETAIQGYKDKLEHYPPDNGGLYSTNQLFYELMGTTNVPAPTPYFQTLDGSAQMPVSVVSKVFVNVSGFVNCRRSGSGDEGSMGTTFIRELKANQFLVVQIAGSDCAVLGLPLDGPADLMLQSGPPNGPKINPWRYSSSNPVHNPKSFDLWIDILVGGKTYRICNWSEQPLVL